MKIISKSFALFFLIGALFFSFATISEASSVAPAPILDSGRIEATILEIKNIAAANLDTGKVKIDKILEYEHHPSANYEALKVGDIIPITFQWGAKKIFINDSSERGLNLPGVSVGEKINVRIKGTPIIDGRGTGWTLFEYTEAGKQDESDEQDELDKEEEKDSNETSSKPKVEKPGEVKEDEAEKTDETKETEEVSAKLIKKKHISSIESIKKDKEQYNVKGYRRAKFLGLIPFNLKLELIIDAKTGNVESVKKPWWSFLFSDNPQ
ncbi:MAG: hypothetical protein WC449_02570 [Candidatus Paceibacterota bacterium]